MMPLTSSRVIIPKSEDSYANMNGYSLNVTFMMTRRNVKESPTTAAAKLGG